MFFADSLVWVYINLDITFSTDYLHISDMILKLYVLHILIDYFPLKQENDHGVFCSYYNLQLYIHLIIYLHS